jgi:hypothetical protein
MKGTLNYRTTYAKASARPKSCFADTACDRIAIAILLLFLVPQSDDYVGGG